MQIVKRFRDFLNEVPVIYGTVPLQAPSSGPSSSGWHRIETAETCARKFAVFYVEGLQPPKMSAALARGSLLHEGMKHHYGQMAKLPWALDPIKAMWQAPADISWTFEECRVILEGYRTWYKNEPFEVLDIEREFEVNIGPYKFTARLDLVVKEGGCAKIYELKSGSELRGVREWKRSGQIIGQCAIGKALFQQIYGIPFGGLVINGLRTGEIRDYKRTPIEISDASMETWPRSVYHWFKQIDRNKTEFGSDSWNWPESHQSCVGRYGQCALYDACDKGKFMIADWLPKATA